MLEILNLLQNNGDNWRVILTSSPYCLKIDEKTINNVDYILFKYDQIESDFSDPIVKECRGIILRKNDWKIVCYPFKKFFNYGEGYSDTIDFETSKVQEKVDGSIMKMWYDGNEWIISTNGKIDSTDVTCAIGKSFNELFIESLKNQLDNDETKYNEFFETLNKHKNYTYIFEMVHPLTRVVIEYDKPDLRHIGTRNNDTYEELDINIGIQKPTEYKFNSFDDVVNMSRLLPYSKEGYVVVDANWNRVKVKSPAYLAVHHLKNNGVISARRVIDIILKGEQSEVLSIFPEFTDYFNVASEIFYNFKAELEKNIDDFKNMTFESKKGFAMVASKTQLPDFFFQVYDGKYTYDDLSKYLSEYGGDKIAKKLKIKDKLLKV
jgi:hypothetical protein